MRETPERCQALVVLAAGTGLRQGEAFGVTMDRVDLVRQTLRVDRQLITLPRQDPFLAPPKTSASVRTVPLPESVTQVLELHIKLYANHGSGLLFTAESGGPIRRTASLLIRHGEPTCGRTPPIARGRLWTRSWVHLSRHRDGTETVPRSARETKAQVTSVSADESACRPGSVPGHALRHDRRRSSI